MKFSFTGSRKFAVKIGSYSQEYPLFAIDYFLSENEKEEMISNSQ